MNPNAYENERINSDYNNNNNNLPNGHATDDEIVKPTYALEHLATFKIKNDAEIHHPKDKIQVLIELEKNGNIWPQKMYMSFNGPWLLMLDSNLKEIENFPGTLIKEPTAFISDDPLESFNNLLVVTVLGVSLGNTEMHIFQVLDVSAVYLVEDLKQLCSGKIVTVDRNKNPIKLPSQNGRPISNHRDQYSIGVAAAEIVPNQQQIEQDILVLNHCFEDIERFIARIEYAAAALKELHLRQDQHNPHGEGLLVLRSQPPTENEFQDIFSKHKLAFNYVVKLQDRFENVSEPIENMFISLSTICNVCNDVYVGARLAENVVNPLLKRETVTFFSGSLSAKNLDFWYSLGPNWTLPKDQFKDHKGSYHPIFYDDWSPDWVVDEEVAYLPPTIKHTPTSQSSPRLKTNAVWLTRLQSRKVKIAEVMFDKTANNDRELSVIKGEHVEIIDDSRNWWKARNSAGTVGYVPNTILVPHNFEQHGAVSEKDTESLSSSIYEHDYNKNKRNMMVPVLPIAVHQPQQPKAILTPRNSTAMPRSYSMPNVPIPPPPPPSDSQSINSNSTLSPNIMPIGAVTTMRPRNDNDLNEEALMLQGSVNDELKFTLQQRGQRRDLEILKTPQIYINQHSKPREIEEWLRCKGFSDDIVKKLGSLNGEELFALSPHVIESYFGQTGSRRLISQIVLQKNSCEYKTLRSSELAAKLAAARKKVDQNDNDPNEIF